MKYSYSLAAAGCVLVLSACGGGGNGSAPAQTSSLSTITAADASKVASNGYAAGNVISQSSLSVTDIMMGVSVAPPGISAVSPLLDLVRKAYDSNGANLLTGVATSDSCTGGGTVTFDETVKTQGSLSNGDTLKITAFNCTENGVTVNGTVSVAVSGASGSASTSGTVTLDASFNNFKIAYGSSAENLNGDMRVSMANTSSSDATVTISGASLSATEQRSGATVATLTLAPYSVSSSIHGTTESDAANFSVSGSANGLGQFAYTVKNLQPIVRTTGSMPTSGSFVINGAASSVTATVVPNGVRVDYSANGNDVVTQTSTLSWSDFLAGSF
jgi:hypothetical protein